MGSRRRTIPFDFYERGYWDTVCFTYILDGMTKEEMKAYEQGFKDGKKGIQLDYQEYKEKYESKMENALSLFSCLPAISVQELAAHVNVSVETVNGWMENEDFKKIRK